MKWWRKTPLRSPWWMLNTAFGSMRAPKSIDPLQWLWRTARLREPNPVDGRRIHEVLADNPAHNRREGVYRWNKHEFSADFRCINCHEDVRVEWVNASLGTYRLQRDCCTGTMACMVNVDWRAISVDVAGNDEAV